MPDIVQAALQPRSPAADRPRWDVAAAGFAWLLLLTLSLAAPLAKAARALGDFRIRATVRVAVLYYAWVGAAPATPAQQPHHRGPASPLPTQRGALPTPVVRATRLARTSSAPTRPGRARNGNQGEVAA
jgi:hypothetical protein